MIHWLLWSTSALLLLSEHFGQSSSRGLRCKLMWFSFSKYTCLIQIYMRFNCFGTYYRNVKCKSHCSCCVLLTKVLVFLTIIVLRFDKYVGFVQGFTSQFTKLNVCGSLTLSILVMYSWNKFIEPLELATTRKSS